MATLLDGKKTAQKVREALKAKVASLPKKKAPGLAAVLVGENPASQMYVGRKEKAAREAGFYSEVHRLDKQISEQNLLTLIHQLNNDSRIHGILVQLPLPQQISQETIFEAVDPQKDVDGFHPINLGRLMAGKPTFIPCTPRGILHLLKAYHIGISGKKAVVVGRSLIVGKPMAHLLLNENATVTLCHSKTKDLEKECRTADILIAAAGKPALIKKSFIKKGAVVIDVGIHRKDNKLMGDVDFKAVQNQASFITPVPGGVGPMTIAMLLQNTWESFSRRV